MRSVIAILAGVLVAALWYQVGAVIALLVTVGIPLGSEPGPPGIGYYTLNLLGALVGALLAGRVTARLARRQPVAHAAGAGAVLALLVLVGELRPASRWPVWHELALAAIALVGTVAGGASPGAAREPLD